MAHSPYTDMAVAFVEENPGCTKFDLARFLTHNPQRNPSRQYYLVNTQIRLGNIGAAQKGGRYYLFPGYAYMECKYKTNRILSDARSEGVTLDYNDVLWSFLEELM